MKILRVDRPSDFPAHLKGGVVAIGNFDGVHRGHQAVLNTAVKMAEVNNVAATVLTFEPHPRTVFKPDSPVPRLTPAPLKAKLIESLGFAGVVEHKFDREFANTNAIDFVQQTLNAELDASHVVTGYDFHFGKGREGSPQFLASNGEKLGFATTIVQAFQDEGGEVISSSRIRDCLGQGAISEANGLLGYAWRVSGVVQKGKQLGRELGYPTANISMPEESVLRHGIYAVRVQLEDGTRYDGVASYGRRPTFDNGNALLESYLFDFSGDLYDQEITVFIFGWIRGEEKFASAEALVEQMNEDSHQAQAVLAAFGPDQGLWPISNS